MRARLVLVVVAFGVSLAALAQLGSPPKQRLPDATAVRAALRDKEVRGFVERTGYTNTRVLPLDDRLTRVVFLKGPRVVLDAAVTPDGRVRATQRHPFHGNDPGSPISRALPVLALLAVVFVLASAQLPLRSARNLDVLALAAFALPIALFDRSLVFAAVWVAYPLLAYLAARCFWVGLRPGGSAPVRTRSLYEGIAARWDARRRTRMLALGTAAAGAAVLGVTMTSADISDVGFAATAGATQLVHGTLPYGHMPYELVHGDTYPLFAFLPYTPLATAWPVYDAFGDMDGALVVAALATLATAGALAYAARRAGGVPAAPAAMLAWFAFPPLMVSASSGSNDLLLAALVAWALVLTARAASSGSLLALACWTKVGPLLVLPLWLAGRRPAGVLRMVAAVVAVSVALTVLLVAIGGFGGIGDMLHALRFQFQRGSLHSVWTVTGARWAQIAAQAALVALVVAGTLRLAASGADARRLAALAGGILLGLQLVANYWTYDYLVWAFPCLALALLAPVTAPTPARDAPRPRVYT